MAERHSIPVGFVGAGRLAAALASGLDSAGYRIRVVGSASIESARSLAGSLGGEVEATADAARVAAVCDLVFLTVPDSAVAAVCEAIPWEPRHVVVHCSGALGLDALADAASKGAAIGCFHPLQTFPSRTPEPGRLKGVYVGIEGDGPDGALLERVTEELGAVPFRLEGVDRAMYHAAAVMASNLVVALTAAATRAWELAGLPAESGREALSPLLLAASENVSRLEFAQALTGPIARGDAATIERHLGALAADGGLSEIYRLLSGELLRLPLGHDAKIADRLRELLDG